MKYKNTIIELFQHSEVFIKILSLGHEACGSRRLSKPRGEKQLNEFLKSRLWNRSKAISVTLTKLENNFSDWKLHSTARNTINHSRQETKLLFFLAFLTPAKQSKEIWNTFLVMKTKFIIPIYQNIGVFKQQNESQVLLYAFSKKILPA